MLPFVMEKRMEHQVDHEQEQGAILEFMSLGGCPMNRRSSLNEGRLLLGGSGVPSKYT